MPKIIVISLVLLSSLLLSACSTLPIATKEDDRQSKLFTSPPIGKAGLYVYRSSNYAPLVIKSISLDGDLIAETIGRVYLYKVISPGEHLLATESEFSDNTLTFTAQAGKNYFFKQRMKLGLLVAGAELESVADDEAKLAIEQCRLVYLTESDNKVTSDTKLFP